MDKPSISLSGPLILTVTGAREGVGKSFVAVNMAIQFALAGRRTVLVDHDMAAASMRPFYSTDENGSSEAPNHLHDFLLNDGIPNLLMILGNNFRLDFATIDSCLKNRLFNKIKEISSAEVVIIDLGGSTSEQALDTLLMADAGIVVTTTGSEALIHTYELLKSAVFRTACRLFHERDDLRAIIHDITTPKKGHTHPTVHDLADAIFMHDPNAANSLLEAFGKLNLYIVFNKAHSQDEVKLAEKLHEICRNSLNIKLSFGGLILQDPDIPIHRDLLVPRAIKTPNSISSRAIRGIGELILNNMPSRYAGGTNKPVLKG